MPKAHIFDEEFLRTLYRFRNKLAHGHTFNQAAFDLKLALHKTQSQMEFLAEYIARESIVKALLEFENEPYFKSRIELQKYWIKLLWK